MQATTYQTMEFQNMILKISAGTSHNKSLWFCYVSDKSKQYFHNLMALSISFTVFRALCYVKYFRRKNEAAPTELKIELIYIYCTKQVPKI